MATVADVVKALRAAIAAGRWKPGEPLPSRSALAAEFGTHPNTIARALQQLNSEGVVQSPTGRAKVYHVAVPQAVSDRAVGFYEDPAWQEPRILTLDTQAVAPPPTVARYLSAPHVLRWVALHLDGMQVISLCEGWYRPRNWILQYTVHPRPSVDFYGQLAEHEGTPLERFEEYVSARVATQDEREYFRETGTAPLVLLDIMRIAWGGNGRALEVCFLRNRASRYRIRYNIPIAPGDAPDDQVTVIRRSDRNRKQNPS